MESRIGKAELNFHCTYLHKNLGGTENCWPDWIWYSLGRSTSSILVDLEHNTTAMPIREHQSILIALTLWYDSVLNVVNHVLYLIINWCLIAYPSSGGTMIEKEA